MKQDPQKWNSEKIVFKFAGGVWICLNCLEISNKYRIDDTEKTGGLIFFQLLLQIRFSGILIQCKISAIFQVQLNNFGYHISLMRYRGIILKFQYALSSFWSIVEQNELKNGRFSKNYYFEENQNLSTVLPLLPLQ